MTPERERIEAIAERLRDHERELARTLEAIRERVTSRQLAGELYERARASGYPRAVGRALRDNPIPTVLAGVCGAWLAKSARDAIAAESARAEARPERATTAEGTAHEAPHPEAPGAVTSGGDAGRSERREARD